jgi:hypothetical protein
MAVWYSLWSFGIFFQFWYVWTKKNLATLHMNNPKYKILLSSTRIVKTGRISNVCEKRQSLLLSNSKLSLFAQNNLFVAVFRFVSKKWFLLSELSIFSLP